MKMWTQSDKHKKGGLMGTLLRSHRGESLVESIVSMAILSILLTSVAGIIITTYRVSSTALERAEYTQVREINPVLAGDMGDPDDPDSPMVFDSITQEITFEIDLGLDHVNNANTYYKDPEIIIGSPIEASHAVWVSDSVGITAFIPKDD